MKFKYFLRGLGVGIIFASVVFFTAYQTGTRGKMTDAEIVKQAKELGMVEKEDPLKDLLPTQVDTATDKETSQEDNENSILGDTTGELEKDSSSVSEREKATEVTTESKEDMVTIKIDGGASSYSICQKLQNAGLIEDANEFDEYLVKNGYASRLRVGEYTLEKGMSFQDIASIISESA